MAHDAEMERDFALEEADSRGATLRCIFIFDCFTFIYRSTHKVAKMMDASLGRAMSCSLSSACMGLTELCCRRLALFDDRKRSPDASGQHGMDMEQYWFPQLSLKEGRQPGY